jgi:hypothetical protein
MIRRMGVTEKIDREDVSKSEVVSGNHLYSLVLKYPRAANIAMEGLFT